MKKEKKVGRPGKKRHRGAHNAATFTQKKQIDAETTCLWKIHDDPEKKVRIRKYREKKVLEKIKKKKEMCVEVDSKHFEPGCETRSTDDSQKPWSRVKQSPVVRERQVNARGGGRKEHKKEG